MFTTASLRWSAPIASAFFVVALLFACILIPSTTACTADFDCRPSSCCHSTGCVDITKAPPPECSEVLCSAECQHNTLDCGGECRCDKTRGICSPYIRAGMPPDSAHTWSKN